MRVVKVLLVLCLGSALASRRAPPIISGTAGATQSYHQQYFGNILEAHYGDTVNIFCSGDDPKNLSIKLNGDRPDGQISAVNTTTLQLSAELPIGVYHYTCTHVGTDCAVKLRVRVLPVITVVSPNVHHKWLPRSGTTYFVPIAEDYEVICYGNPELYITNRRDMGIISLNETTIKTRKLQGIEYSRHVYYCANKENIGAATPNIEVLFDYVPAATNVWCTEYEWQINCLWSVLSKDTTFTLFYTDKDGNSMRIYEDFSGSMTTRHSEWSLKDVWKHSLAISENLNLIIQACNPVYCSNQTYIVDRKSIIKTGSPVDLNLLKKTSHSAFVTWRGPHNSYYDKTPVDYKLTYRLSGAQLGGSSSQITCDLHAMRYLDTCEGELQLPCPGALYEVELYSKFTSTPSTSDAYWSEPARISLRTDPPSSSDTVDPACLKEPELIDNKYVAVYEVKKLERSFRKEGSALQVKVKALEHKLDKMKLCRELSLDECEHFGLLVV